MSVIVCDQVLEQGANEALTHAIDFTTWLRKPLGWREGDAAAATLSTLTSITDQASVLTLASKTILGSDTVPRHRPDTVIKAAHGVSFKASGGVAGTAYVVKTLVIDSDGNTWELYCKLQIVGAPT